MSSISAACANSAVFLKLVPAGRIPPKELHFRCSHLLEINFQQGWFGLTVYLSKSLFCRTPGRPGKDNTFPDPSSARRILPLILLSSRGKQEKNEIFFYFFSTACYVTIPARRRIYYLRYKGHSCSILAPEAATGNSHGGRTTEDGRWRTANRR